MVRLIIGAIVVIAITWFIAFQILPLQAEQVVEPIVRALASQEHDQSEFVATVIFLEAGIIMLVLCQPLLWLMRRYTWLVWPRIMVWLMVYAVASMFGISIGSLAALLVSPLAEKMATITFIVFWLLFCLGAGRLTGRLKDKYEDRHFRRTSHSLKQWQIWTVIAIECLTVFVLSAIAREYYPI